MLLDQEFTGSHLFVHGKLPAPKQKHRNSFARNHHKENLHKKQQSDEKGK
jgi:hypothetical protein